MIFPEDESETDTLVPFLFRAAAGRQQCTISCVCSSFIQISTEIKKHKFKFFNFIILLKIALQHI